jgi:Ca2+-binding RTX toxin-like protein
MATFTIGSGGNFATITAALASGSVVPGDTLALLSGYNTENATVEIENLTFSGDASNTDIALTLSTGIMAITLTGTAPIAVTGNESNNSITGNDGSNVLAGGEGNDSIKGGAGDDTINGGAGADTIYYTLADDFIWVGDGIDSINGGTDHDTLIIEGTPYFEQKGLRRRERLHGGCRKRHDHRHWRWHTCQCRERRARPGRRVLRRAGL